MKTKPQSKRPGRRLSRVLLEKSLEDLMDRIAHQIDVAASVKSVAAPDPETMARDFPLLRVIELVMDTHLRELRNIHDFADMLTRGQAVQS
jgi:hypothetical protein